jgi:hypothetical protein
LEEYLEAVDLEAIYLEAIYLEAIYLEAIYLEAIDLEATDLEAINLKAVNLEAVNLEAVNLEVVNLKAVNLEAVDREAGAMHRQKNIPFGQNGSARVDTLRQSLQRHPGGRLLHARRQYKASHCISLSDRCFTVSLHSVGLLF